MKHFMRSALLASLALLAFALPCLAEGEKAKAPMQLAQLEGAYYEPELFPTGASQTGGTEHIAPDSVEGWNRFWFQFNDKFYYWLAKPVAQGYGYVVPEKPRRWVNNFFTNLLFPVRFVNCLLQGKLRSAGVETSKFILNSSYGVLGFGDPAGKLKPTAPTPSGDEDLGQTFGRWGIGNGTYLVWPIIGASTVRDSFGYAGDYFLKPVSYITPWYDSLAVTAYDKINNLSLRIGEYEDLTESAIDPYVALRDAYLRYRANKVNE